jgi:predicted ester cyclase
MNNPKGVNAMKQLMQTNLKVGSLFLMMVVLMSSGCQQQPDASKTLKPLAAKYVGVWNSGNMKDLDAIIDPHFVRHVNLQPDVEGVDGIKKVISGFRTAYPDLNIVLNDELYSENKSAGRWTLTGTNTGPGQMSPTGKSVKLWGTSLLHYANGKLTEEWVGFDNQSLMEQLGYAMTLPSETKPQRK